MSEKWTKADARKLARKIINAHVDSVETLDAIETVQGTGIAGQLSDNEFDEFVDEICNQIGWANVTVSWDD